MRRVLRCVPDAGSGDAVAPIEVAAQLDLPHATVHQLLIRAFKRGLVTRLRPGAYVLPKGSRP
jgi:DNA-binding IclR family transcriptional regulator